MKRKYNMPIRIIWYRTMSYYNQEHSYTLHYIEYWIAHINQLL